MSATKENLYEEQKLRIKKAQEELKWCKMEKDMEMENHDCHAGPEDSCDCQLTK